MSDDTTPTHHHDNEHHLEQHDGEQHDGELRDEQPDRKEEASDAVGLSGPADHGAHADRGGQITSGASWPAAPLGGRGPRRVMPGPRIAPDDHASSAHPNSTEGTHDQTDRPGPPGPVSHTGHRSGAGAGAGADAGADAGSSGRFGSGSQDWEPDLSGFNPDDTLVIVGHHRDETDTLAFGRLHTLEPDDPDQLRRIWWQYKQTLGDVTESVTLVGYADPDDLTAWSTLTAVGAACPLPVRDIVLITAVHWWILNCPSPRDCPSPACQPDGAEVTLDNIPDPTTLTLHPYRGLDSSTVGGPVSGPADGTVDEPVDDRAGGTVIQVTFGTDTGTSAGVAGDVAEGTPEPTTHLIEMYGVLDAGVLPGPTPARDAVAAHLPGRFTDDHATNQMIFRDLLSQQHTAHRTPVPAPMSAQMTAVLLEALADETIRNSCLIWNDPAAWRLYLALIRDAPARWSAPVWALLAAHAYGNGYLDTAWTAVQHALADQPGLPFADVLRRGLQAELPPEVMRRALFILACMVPDHLRQNRL